MHYDLKFGDQLIMNELNMRGRVDQLIMNELNTRGRVDQLIMNELNTRGRVEAKVNCISNVNEIS